jgi:hypothetical protein
MDRSKGKAVPVMLSANKPVVFFVFWDLCGLVRTVRMEASSGLSMEWQANKSPHVTKKSLPRNGAPPIPFPFP